MIVSSYANLPKLTVIMAVRNAVGTVGRALDSLASQHYPKLEFIVRDCVSSDGTLDVLARHDDLITHLISETDEGPTDAYNQAASVATGDFIGYLNADDEFEPGMLWAVAEAILKQPGADVVSTGIVTRSLNRYGDYMVVGYYASPKQLALTLENVLSELPSFLLSRFIRRELHAKMGPFNMDRASWYISNDREWMARLALTPCINVSVPHALYGFNVHARGYSSNPESFARIIEEHQLIAQSLLARTDITEAHRSTIRRWQKRQLAFGLWKSLAQLRFEKARDFLRRGMALAHWPFFPYAVSVLADRGARKLSLAVSGGIDRGKD